MHRQWNTFYTICVHDHACMCVSACIHVCTNVWIFMYVCMCSCVHIHACVCDCMFVCAGVCACLCIRCVLKHVNDYEYMDVRAIVSASACMRACGSVRAWENAEVCVRTWVWVDEWTCVSERAWMLLLEYAIECAFIYKRVCARKCGCMGMCIHLYLCLGVHVNLYVQGIRECVWVRLRAGVCVRGYMYILVRTCLCECVCAWVRLIYVCVFDYASRLKTLKFPSRKFCKIKAKN